MNPLPSPKAIDRYKYSSSLFFQNPNPIFCRLLILLQNSTPNS